MLIEESLQARWVRLCRSMRCGPKPTKYLSGLIGAYSEKHRAYHTLEHIQRCLFAFDHVTPLANHPHELEFALWFHDAIYEPSATDNEEQSAAWAVRVLQENDRSPTVIERVQSLITATKHNSQPITWDACLMVDIDLAILGYPTPQFDQYESQIRHEYQHLPDELFCAGRVHILESFLARETLYYTQPFQKKYEDQARVNLQRSIFKLRSVLK